jgi:hypothetical protein
MIASSAIDKSLQGSPVFLVTPFFAISTLPAIPPLKMAVDGKVAP